MNGEEANKTDTKSAKLSTTNQMLDEKYGAYGTELRNEFEEQSLAWFYGYMLKDHRKELKMTQKEVAEKLGREQSNIARVERGKADIQLSSFFKIASILGIQFVPSFVQV